MMSPLLGFARLTSPDGADMIVAIDDISMVVGSMITIKSGFRQFAVQESHDEILLRIGLPITPRAETIMKP